MFYHEQCREVVDLFKKGNITKEAARARLGYIEEEAYKRIPEAELDGDITFATASALGEIEEMEEANKLMKKQIYLLVFDDGIDHKIETAFFSGRKAQELSIRYNGEECVGPYDVVTVDIEDAEDEEGV